MSASIRVPRWTQLATVGAIAVASATTIAPSAGAAAQTKRHHGHHHRRHHRRHTTAVQARTAGCPWANTPATSASISEMRSAVVCLVNEQRNAHGLPSLRASTKLDRSAQSWNQWMVTTGNFTHGTNFAGRISAVGYDWQTAGENIATGFSTPRSVVNAWMASPDHCRNILDPSFRNVGTGVTASAVGSWASQPSTWTQDFGLLMSENPLSGNTGPQNGCPY